MGIIILKNYSVLSDGVIDIVSFEKYFENESKGFVPDYQFHIKLHDTDTAIGRITLRNSNTEKIVKYIGHIGYGIDELYRGNRYASKACKLVERVAIECGMEKLIITCNPDNFASRRTCEIIGAHFLEVIDIPETSSAYSYEEKKKCRYEWILFKENI